MSTTKRADSIIAACALASVLTLVAILAALLSDLIQDAWPRLGSSFFTNFPSRRAEQAGILAAFAGSFALIALVVVISLPLGVGAALYLEEYARKSRFTRLIEINIANLAGVPSVIYGILGLQLFARYAGFGRSLLTGALTMSLLILPVIIIASREALRAVPRSIRDGAMALGATRWEAIWHQVLPMAIPGIMTGSILAFSRAIGEAAPLITIGALTFVAFLPDGIFSEFTVLPIQAFNWLSRPQEAFHANAAAAIVVLLALLLLLNSFVIWIRMRFEKRLA